MSQAHIRAEQERQEFKIVADGPSTAPDLEANRFSKCSPQAFPGVALEAGLTFARSPRPDGARARLDHVMECLHMQDTH